MARLDGAPDQAAVTTPVTGGTGSGRSGRGDVSAGGTRRSAVGKRPSSPPGGARAPRRIGIGLKFGALAVVLVLLLTSTVVALLAQANSITTEYDTLLTTQVRQILVVRQIQVEFKKQVQEWKDILLRGFDPTDLATYTANFRSQDTVVDQLTDVLLQQVTETGVRQQLVQFRAAHGQLDAQYQKSYTAFVASGGHDFKASDRMVRGLDRPPTAALETVTKGLDQAIAASVAHRKVVVAQRQRAVLAEGAAVGLVIMILLGLSAWRLVRPIRYLTAAADRAAHETLPQVIERIRAMPPGSELPALPSFDVRTRDELRDLGQALTRLQASAVELAAGQRRAEGEAAEMLVNLGRRNQNLLSRLLSQVTTLERAEQDPNMLAQLFRLDHAATRIRRNAESMLVLAGAAQTRTYSRPVPVAEMIRAALSEVEDYARVDLYHVEDAEVSGSTAADVVHLMAELVENATHFSPPSSQVTVVGQRLRDGYRIRISDQGVGMTERELTEANERILRASRDWGDTRLLGLYVVGQLATRWGIQVILEPAAGRGITASVLLPPEVLDTGRQPSGAVPGPAPVAAGPRTPAAGAAVSAAAPSPAMSSPAASGPAGSGPAASGPAASGPAASGPAASGPAARADEPRPVPRERVISLDDPLAGEPVPAARQAATVRGKQVPQAAGGQPPGPARRPPPAGPPAAGRASVPVGSPRFAKGVNGLGAEGLRPVRPRTPPPQPPRPEVTSPAEIRFAAAPGATLPTRVRGAQLAELGLAEAIPEVRFDVVPESSQQRLRGFQRDVEAARRAIAARERGAAQWPELSMGPERRQHADRDTDSAPREDL